MARGNGNNGIIGGLWISTNACPSWTERIPGVTLEPIAFHPTNADEILIGSSIGFGEHAENLYKSTDGGITWNNSVYDQNSTVYSYGTAASFNPFDANQVIIAMDYFPQISNDGGQTLNQIAAPFHNAISVAALVMQAIPSTYITQARAVISIKILLPVPLLDTTCNRLQNTIQEETTLLPTELWLAGSLYFPLLVFLEQNSRSVLTIFSVTGQKVLESKTADFSVSGLYKGIYAVKVTAENGKHSYKNSLKNKLLFFLNTLFYRKALSF